VVAFRSVVTEYWKRSGRDHLPWRKTRDPYRILVSEMMLQQTQVERVIPYYERFLKRFPDAGTLAAAPLSQVLKLWSGLGYNRRAKYLHEAARRIHTDMLFSRGRGTLAYEDLRKLPGVGDYTAKAVRVFAWNEPEVLIETNVRAAFISHFFPRGKKVPDARLLPLISEALEGQDPRSWYAALMDYGTYLKATQPNPSRRSVHHAKQTRFEGSLREMRGAILKAVVRGEDPAARDRGADPRFAEALAQLKREGLLDRA
jgi:A/G-specific adenine glycosylase